MLLKPFATVNGILATPFLIAAMIDETSGRITAVALRRPFIYILLEPNVTEFPRNLVPDDVDAREVCNEVFTREVDGIGVIKGLRRIIQGVKEICIFIHGQIGCVDSSHDNVQELSRILLLFCVQYPIMVVFI